MQPDRRPSRPEFSSGPCVKRPGWSPAALAAAVIGRSHRAKTGKQRIQAVIEQSGALLGIPEGWKLGIVPGSDSGAFEMAMWNLLGARPVDVLVWESFGAGWVTDVVKQLKLEDVRVLEADYGHLPDLAAVDIDMDIACAVGIEGPGIGAVLVGAGADQKRLVRIGVPYSPTRRWRSASHCEWVRMTSYIPRVARKTHSS